MKYIIWRKSWNVFKNLNFFLTEERKTDILDDMGVNKLSAKVFSKKKKLHDLTFPLSFLSAQNKGQEYMTDKTLNKNKSKTKHIASQSKQKISLVSSSMFLKLGFSRCQASG